jgi:hypothetical protein
VPVRILKGGGERASFRKADHLDRIPYGWERRVAENHFKPAGGILKKKSVLGSECRDDALHVDAPASSSGSGVAHHPCKWDQWQFERAGNRGVEHGDIVKGMGIEDRKEPVLAPAECSEVHTPNPDSGVHQFGMAGEFMGDMDGEPSTSGGQFECQPAQSGLGIHTLATDDT